MQCLLPNGRWPWLVIITPSGWGFLEWFPDAALNFWSNDAGKSAQMGRDMIIKTCWFNISWPMRISEFCFACSMSELWNSQTFVARQNLNLQIWKRMESKKSWVSIKLLKRDYILIPIFGCPGKRGTWVWSGMLVYAHIYIYARLFDILCISSESFAEKSTDKQKKKYISCI